MQFHLNLISCRILLAEYFNEKLLYNIIGFALRNAAFTFVIDVVHPDFDFEDRVSSTAAGCQIDLSRISNLQVQFHIMTIQAYFEFLSETER